MGAAISPDGRWLAYQSTTAGADEVWLKEYPDGAPKRVSTNGGRFPVWSRDGRELYYLNADKMMAVAISAAPGQLSFGSPGGELKVMFQPESRQIDDLTMEDFINELVGWMERQSAIVKKPEHKDVRYQYFTRKLYLFRAENIGDRNKPEQGRRDSVMWDLITTISSVA